MYQSFWYYFGTERVTGCRSRVNRRGADKAPLYLRASVVARPHGGAVLFHGERVKGCGGGTSLGGAKGGVGECECLILAQSRKVAVLIRFGTEYQNVSKRMVWYFWYTVPKRIKKHQNVYQSTKKNFDTHVTAMWLVF